MIKWSHYINPRKAYGRGLITGALIGFICGVMSTGQAETQYECQSFREILESFEYDYNPRYEAPPMKPE